MTDPLNDTSPREPRARGRRRPSGAQSRLIVYAPHAPPLQVLCAGSVSIGRGSGADILLDDPRASRMHAVIEPSRRGKHEVRDCGSRNGTAVNRRAVERQELASNDVIRVGDTLIVFEDKPIDLDEARWDRSSAARSLDRAAERAGRRSVPVLLLGPTGSGKSWLARRIAEGSSYGSPFVHLNCAALAPSLVEAELFGASKGAYTGASRDRSGLFESANGGTLFLDEVACLSLELQSKLLVALDNKAIRRVGSNEERPIDVRVIAATNTVLQNAVDQRDFREDLMFRLAGFSITLPPLTDRRVDIIPFAAQALRGADHRVFTPNAVEHLLTAPWPGNLRELLNLTAALSRSTAQIDVPALPLDLPEAPRPQVSESRPSRARLEALLKEHRGNVSAVARALGKHRTQVRRWMTTLGVKA